MILALGQMIKYQSKNSDIWRSLCCVTKPDRLNNTYLINNDSIWEIGLKKNEFISCLMLHRFLYITVI